MLSILQAIFLGVVALAAAAAVAVLRAIGEKEDK